MQQNTYFTIQSFIYKLEVFIFINKTILHYNITLVGINLPKNLKTSKLKT